MQTLSFEQVKHLKDRLMLRMSESATYTNWSPEFARNNVTDFITEERKTKAIDPNVFTHAQAIELSFGNWNGSLLLIPLWMHPFLKAGIELKCIDSGTYTVAYDAEGKCNIDNDHRFGCLAYGVEYPSEA